MRHPLRALRRALVSARAILGTAFAGVNANRMRAFLSTLGIAIGVATLMAIYAMVTGLTDAFTRQVAQLGANTFFVTSRPWMAHGDWWRFRNRPPITRQDAEALERDGTLFIAVAPAAFAAADVSYLGEHDQGVQIRGTVAAFLDTSTLKVAAGRFLSPLDDELESPVVVIGSELQDRLFRTADPVGAYVNVAGQRFQVIGVFAEQGKAFGRSLDNIAIIPLGRFSRVFGARRDLAIAIAADPAHLNEAEDEVIEIMRRHRGLGAGVPENFAINRQSELVKMFTEGTSSLFSVAVAVGLITLLVGGIGVMNIMLVAVTERTREIGLRRALGARQRTILLQFLTEAILVTLAGGAIGTAAGLGGARLLAMTTPLSATVSPQAAVIGVLFSAFVGLLFGTWPAYRAAHLDPIESLRYE
jgi:putative ABC transport system permease protein